MRILVVKVMQKNFKHHFENNWHIKQTKTYFVSENEDNSIQLNDCLTSELLYTSMEIRI